MKLACKLCSHESISESTSAVIDSLMHHLTRQHKQATAELAALIAATSGYLAVRLFGTLPDEENELRAQLAETERELFGIISGDVVMRLRDVMMMEKPRGGQGGTN